jgi:hypothetical protein
VVSFPFRARGCIGQGIALREIWTSNVRRLCIRSILLSTGEETWVFLHTLISIRIPMSPSTRGSALPTRGHFRQVAECIYTGAAVVITGN